MFSGLRVLEFGQYVAGPITGMLLGDLGAEVIKVERPGGDPIQALPAYHTWNRGKRIVELDLKTDSGLAEAARLAEGADVIIDCLRPGLLLSCGLDLAALAKDKPSLITCAITGFGKESGLETVPAWESLIAAISGAFGPSPGEPQFNPLPFASTYAAILAANCIAAALLVRERSGHGQQIAVPIHGAVFLAAGFRLVRINQEPPLRSGSHPLVTTYQCADGRWVQLHAATPKFVAGFMSATNTASWWDEGLFDRSRWAAEPGLMDELDARLTKLFAERPAGDWERALSAAGLCCIRCQTVEEWLAHPHAAESGLVVELETPLGRMRQPGPLIRAEGPHPLRAAAREHSGLRWESASLPPASTRPEVGPPKAALDGLRVVDLCLILAGPTCGRVLAEFGADVVKVDGRAPSVTEAFWIDTNRGKRSLVVDLKTEGGREILWKLLESADVVVENFRQGVAERLGFGYHQVSARLPRLIYASMNAYGYAGSMAAWPGWEQLAQAATGMQVRFGGRNGKPQTVHYAVNDYASGLALSFGVMGALREREHTGRGQRVVTSLAATAGLLQSLYMFDYPGYERCEIEGQTVTGTGPLSRIYACADGWIYFHCPKRAWPSVVRAPELAGLALGLAGDLSGGFPAEVTSAFEQRLREGSADSWVHCLNANGATAVRLHSPDELLDSPALRAAGLITTSQSPHLGRIEHVGIPHQLSLTPARIGRPPPALGGDTIEILRELGYPDLQIGRWFGERVIAAYAR